MAIFNNHPVFKAIGDVENTVQNIMVSNKRIVIDSDDKFGQGIIQGGYVLNGDLYANDYDTTPSATPVNLVYTSTVLFSQRVEEWKFVNINFGGNLYSIQFRTSQDGVTFSSWKEIALGDIFSATAPYFQFKIEVGPASVIYKVEVGFDEKTPDIAKMLDTLSASIGQANVDFDTHYTYDSNGNIAEQRYSGGIVKVLRYGYDPYGNVQLVEVEDGGTVSRQYFEYDSYGNVIYMGTRNRRNSSKLVQESTAYEAVSTNLDETLLDEIEVAVEVSEDVKATQAFQFDDVELPERHTEAGKKAWNALNNKIHGRKLDVQINKKDDKGRLRGKLLVGGEDIATWLVNNGYAKRIS